MATAEICDMMLEDKSEKSEVLWAYRYLRRVVTVISLDIPYSKRGLAFEK